MSVVAVAAGATMLGTFHLQCMRLLDLRVERLPWSHSGTYTKGRA